MSSPLPTLDTLRREIDEIDDAIHNLLMRRCRLVEQIGRVKANSGPAMKPAREAMILRRLAARHEGDFPIPVLLRMWREMLAGTKLLQGPLAVAVGTQDAGRGLWDMARDHYGSTVPTTAMQGPMQALRAVMDGRATVAVLPLPDDDEVDPPWWTALMSRDPPHAADRGAAAVPRPRGRGRGHSTAFSVALATPEPTGDDQRLPGDRIGRGYQPRPDQGPDDRQRPAAGGLLELRSVPQRGRRRCCWSRWRTSSGRTIPAWPRWPKSSARSGSGCSRSAAIPCPSGRVRRTTDSGSARAGAAGQPRPICSPDPAGPDHDRHPSHPPDPASSTSRPMSAAKSQAVVHPGLGRTARLASNESALGASPRAIEAYRKLGDQLHR